MISTPTRNGHEHKGMLFILIIEDLTCLNALHGALME
uniref:Uncharacterized protein n=1 Tax=Arundo donax TaxID=35708 RepID=A0A0A8ZNX1_ARUDO